MSSLPRSSEGSSTTETCTVEAHNLLNDEGTAHTADCDLHHSNGSISNRDSGIQDGESTEPQAHVEYGKCFHSDKDDVVLDLAQAWPRRGSGISANSMRTSSTMEIDPKDEVCGWGPFSPKLCQRFRNPRWVLVWLSLAGVCQGMIVNGFVLTSISTLERRFDLKSSETGLIASGYDLAFLVCLIPVSYLGGVKRKPHWLGIGVLIMGLGSIVFILPHFTTDLYQPTSSSAKETCMRGSNSSIPEEICGSGLLNRYKYVFIFGQMLHGMGATPLYTLGVSYLDDNLLPSTTSLYVAIFYSLSILGPAVGFLLGGVFLNIYTDAASIDVDQLQLSPSNPKWVGAWWIGFIFAAALCFIGSVGLGGFPKYLPGRKSVLKLKVSEAHADKGTSGAFSGSLNEFPIMLKKLLCNPTFVFISLAGTMEGLLLSGFATFGIKFVQNQFSVSASKASVIVGAIVVPAGGGGTFLGGWIIKHKDLKLRSIVRLCTVFAAVSFFLCLGYLIQCKGSSIAGVNYPYKGENVVDLNANCNMDCLCSKERYNPVCGADSVLYFSACHAGCLSSGSLVDSKDNSQSRWYGSCSCIDPTMVFNASIEYQAKEGQCDSDCELLPVFLLFFFGVTVFTFLASMPALSVTLRSVPENQKSFALGIQWLIIRALGTIPAGPMIGGIIDYSCILWQEECGENGSCYAYDNKNMGVYLMCTGLIVKFFSVLFLVLTYVVYKPPVESKKDTAIDSEVDVNFIVTQEDVSQSLNTHNETTEL
ncbi:solute carrier organic anion transporter family member 4A1-like [Watersipora subatra]|uniref:solute carrier organic anion transporter family member 4A1-like n=1 Tax=Watersipora subatra TaxID=2589382 RepID=UPI00355C4785